jgi:glycosyl hydrolase family 123/cellulose/xylan binding protein with CBM9 domain
MINRSILTIFICLFAIFANITGIAQDYKKYSQLSEWKIQTWKGKGRGAVDSKENQITLKGGVGAMDQTVAVLYKPVLNIKKDGYLRFSAKLQGKDIGNFALLYAAVRSGGLKDLKSRKLSGSFSWQEVSLILHPAEEISQASYFAIRLYGPGKLELKDVQISPLDEKTAKALAKKEASELKQDREKRIGALMQSHKPTLRLANKDSVAQFKAWGTKRPAYSPYPNGWKEVARPAGDNNWEKPFISPKAKKDGYQIFSRSPLDVVSLDTQARVQDVSLPLRSFATPGEFEPLTFSVRALRNLKNVRVKLNELKSSRDTIPASHIDVRTVGFMRVKRDESRKRFYHEPFLLEKGPDFIDKDTTRRYWITVSVPENASPGIYKGEILFSADGISPRTIPVSFRVLPFHLNEPENTNIVWWARHGHKYPLRKDAVDMKEHGMTTLLAEVSVPTRDRKVDDKDIEKMADSLDEFLKIHKELGFRDKMIGGHSNHCIVFQWDNKIKWFRMYPPSEALDKEFLSVYKRLYIDEAKKRNWPEILHYPFDEPGGARPELLKPTGRYLKLLKNKFPQLKTWVTFGGGIAQGYDEFGILGPYLDYWVINRFNPDIDKTFKDHKKELWVYNGGISTFGATRVPDQRRNRFFYGVYAEKIGAKGVGQWVYAFDQPFKQPFCGNTGFVFFGEDGPLPSTYWENLREGIDDRRYLQLLKKKIAEAKKAGNKKKKALAKNAQKLVDSIMAQVSNRYQTGSDTPDARLDHFDYSVFDAWRKAIAQEIMKLDGTLKSCVAATEKDSKDLFDIENYNIESKTTDPFPLPEKRNGKAYRISKAPVIDGTLSEDEWKEAGLIEDFTYALFRLNSKAKHGYATAPVQQRVYVGYDDDAVYVAYENPLPKGTTPKTNAVHNDGNVWADDSVEFFIKPGMGPSPYWVFIANSKGVWLDGKIKNTGWNGEWETASSVENGKWICEIRIPWKNIDFTPRKGAKILMNFYRSDYPNGKYATWSPIDKGAHEPENFGLVELCEKKASPISIVRLDSPKVLKKGKNVFSCLLRTDRAGEIKVELSRNDKSIQTLKKKVSASEKIVSVKIPLTLKEKGKYRIQLNLNSGSKTEKRTFNLDFSGKLPLELKLQKEYISENDKVFACKFLSNIPDAMGSQMTLSIISDKGKIVAERKFKLEKTAAMIQMGIKGWTPGKYNCRIKSKTGIEINRTFEVVKGI